MFVSEFISIKPQSIISKTNLMKEFKNQTSVDENLRESEKGVWDSRIHTVTATHDHEVLMLL